MSDKNNHESIKAQIDYLKHMTTISTGSILLLATFLEKLFAKPLWKPAIVVSFIGFMVAVICSVIAHSMYVLNKDAFGEKELEDWRLHVAAFSFLGMWLGFLTGVLSLAVFGIRNFL